ncbi:MAG: thiol oxidoreductase, partial [Anditalea sp.]
MDRKLLYTLSIAAFTLTCIICVGCEEFLPSLPLEEDLLDGPVELNTEQQAAFLEGDIAFNDEVFTPEAGLGAVFVSTSCGSCHAGDGKGHPSTTLIRFTPEQDSTGNTVLEQGPTQLQNRAIPGYVPEQIPEGVPFSKFTPPAVTGLGLLDLVSDADLLAMADPDDSNGDGI